MRDADLPAPFRLVPSQTRARKFTVAVSAGMLVLGVLMLWAFPDIPWPVGVGVCALVALLHYGLATWDAGRNGARLVEAGPGGLVVERLNGRVDRLDWDAVEWVTLLPAGVVFKPRGRRAIAVNTDGLDEGGRERLDALAKALRERTET